MPVLTLMTRKALQGSESSAAGDPASAKLPGCRTGFGFRLSLSPDAQGTCKRLSGAEFSS